MRKIPQLLLTFLMACFISSMAFAQSIDAENTHELSKKARKGELAKIFYNEDDKTTSLVYVTKFTNKRIKYEMYRFDENFVFLDKEEIEEEYEKYKKKFKVKIRLPKWQKEFEGQETFTKDYVAAYTNIAGTLVLYQTRNHYKWSHRWDRFFLKKSEQLEKLKPKNEENEKFQGHTWGYNYDSQELIILTSAFRDYTPETFNLMVFNTDFDMVKTTEIKLPSRSRLVLSLTVPKKGTAVKNVALLTQLSAPEPSPTSIGGALISAFKNKPLLDMSDNVFQDDEFIYDYEQNESIMIFEDAAVQTPPTKNKEKGAFRPAPTRYYLVRLSNRGEIIEQKELNGFTPYVPGTLQTANIAMRGADLFLSFETDFSPTMKVKAAKGTVEVSDRTNAYFTFAKFANGSDVAFSTTSRTGDLLATLKNNSAVTPKVEKKMAVMLPSINSLELGTDYHFITGLSTYNGFGILYNGNGTVLGAYRPTPGMATAYSGGKPTAYFNGINQTFYSSKKLYWVMIERGLKLPLLSPRMARIDLKTGTYDSETLYGIKSKKEAYYLDADFPILAQGKANTITFFGSDAKEKKVWFSRVKFDE